LNHRYRLILHEEKLAVEQINNLCATYKNS